MKLPSLEENVFAIMLMNSPAQKAYANIASILVVLVVKHRKTTDVVFVRMTLPSSGMECAFALKELTLMKRKCVRVVWRLDVLPVPSMIPILVLPALIHIIPRLLMGNVCVKGLRT